MTDTVHILRETPGSVLLIEAMVDMLTEQDNHDLIKRYNLQAEGDGSTAQVTVLVNGIEVSFLNVIEPALKRMTDRYAADVKEAAMKLLKGSPLFDLYNRIENAEWEITRALDKVIMETNL